MPDPGNILIVDDNESDLRLLVNILSEQGHVVRPTLDGGTALLSVRQEQPDLILLDVRMRQMDGYEVCNRLKADKLTKDIPVIFISASNEVFDKVKAFSSGSVDYITKPFEIEEVTARINTQLKLCRLHNQLKENNKILQQEITQRQLAMSALHQTQNELEQRVAERTVQLDEVNQNLQAEINRRELISQDLHDHIIQSLYGSSLLLTSLNKRLPANTEASSRELLNQAIQQINQGILEIRQFIEQHTYHHEEVGFAQALAKLANWAQLGNAPNFRLEIDQAVSEKLSQIETEQLVTIAREAISNCLRYSRAKHAWIILTMRDDQIVFEVGDDGIGFDLIAQHDAGQGLSNMRKRVEEISGQLSVLTKLHGGVRVIVTLSSRV